MKFKELTLKVVRLEFIKVSDNFLRITLFMQNKMLKIILI